ncbi:MAG: FtsW/RodA/SpoVE family cell cycle protein, partial [Anaeromassilibacillus sp.]
MYNVKCLNKISPVGLARFGANYTCGEDVENPEAILVRSASMHEMELPSSLLAIARAGAGVNNIPLDKCSEAGICVFNTPGANANAVKELVIAGLLLASRKIVPGIEWAKGLKGKGAEVGKLVEKGKSQFVGPEISGKRLGVIGLGAIGILVAILLSNIDYRRLVNVWPVHVVLTWGLVLPTLVIRNVTLGPLTIGYNAGDTDNYSWYKLGGFTFQPTELAKISFILTFAMHLNNVRSRLNEPKELGKLLLHLFVPIGIIHIQGDDGTAIIYGIIGCCMLFAAGLSWKYI